METELLKEPFIQYHANSAIQKICSRMLSSGNILHKIQTGMEVRSLAAMAKYIEAGLGVGFISSLVKNENLKILAIPELTFQRQFYLVYRQKQEGRLKEAASKIVEIAQSIF